MLILLIGCMSFCLMAAPASATPAIVGSDVQTASLLGSGGTASFSFNYTSDSGPSRMLLVGISMNVSNSTGSTVSSITYNGAALTFAGSRTYFNQRRVELWSLVNPASGSNSLVINVNVTNGRRVGVVATITSFDGVDQTTPLGTVGTDTGNGGNGSINITSATTDLVVDQIATTQNSTIVSGQTQYQNTNSGTGPTDIRGASSWITGSSPTTNMAEAVSGGRWVMAAVNVRQTASVADLATSATAFTVDPVALNASTSTTFTITNNGPQSATGATFTLTFSANVGSATATPSTGSCTGTGPITCTFPTIANGNSVTVGLSVTATTEGVISVTGTASDTVEFDPPGNSSATVTAKAQSPCGTPGNDGAGGTLTGVVNSYFPGTSTGSGTITVGAGTGANKDISSGDLLLVIQMQDADINTSNTSAYGANNGTGAGYTNLNSAGRYEFVIATSSVTFASGGSFTFDGGGVGGGLIYTYTSSGASTGKGVSRFQVVRVPQYTSATLSSGLTANAWNGTTGGVLAIDVADSLTLGGSVSVDAKGFRGGGGRVLGGATGGTSTDYVKLASFAAHAPKGEGIAGTPQYVYNGALLNNGSEGLPTGSGSMARGAPGNGGGGGADANPTANDENSGGGGGSNGGAGGQGGNSWNANLADGGIGGVALTGDQTRLFMGGGGGAGTTNNGTSDPNTNTTGVNSSGAVGGGIVIIRAAEITGTGTISANGANALNVMNDGGGGGGAGGTIMVVTKTGTLAGLTLSAKGGNGGNAWATSTAGTCNINSVPIGSACNYHGPGGGGGGGVILTSSAPASTDVSGGTHGITTTANAAFNSTAGSNGVTSSSAVFTALPGTDAAALCAPDLSTTKTGNGPWIRGNSFSYTLGVSNLGINSTSGVVTLTDTLPTGMVPATASGTGWLCSVASQTVACNRSDALSGGQSYGNVTIGGTVGQTTADSVVNTATASGGSEFYTGNDSASNTSSANSVADVSVTSADSPDPVSAGGTITYTQIVSNSGPSDAGNATYSTTVPANTGFQSISIPSGWSCATPPVGQSGTITCVTNYLAAGTSATFVVVTKVNATFTSGVLMNVAVASSIAADPNLTNNSVISSTTVGSSPADVTLTNSVSPTATTAGNNLTYTQIVNNQGGSSASSVTFTGSVPTNTTFQSLAIPSGWSCPTVPSVGGTGAISCNIGSLIAGGTSTFTLTVKINAGTAQGTAITDTAMVSASNDSLTGNNSASASAVVTLGSQADLVVTNVPSTTQVYAGDSVSFDQTISNNGPGTAAGISVLETIPSGTTFVSVTPPAGWTCTAPSGGTFTCSGASLAMGASATIMMQVKVASNATNGTAITDTVSATTTSGDPNSANNSNISATAIAITGANLVVTNTLGTGNDPVTAGGSYTLSQTVSNSGPSDSGTITVIETIPANTIVGTITKPAGWSCGSQVGNTITCSGPSLAAGASALNFSIPLTVNGGTAAGALLTETVSATPGAAEVIPADNAASYTNSVTDGTLTDLAVTSVTTTPAPVIAGQNLTFDFTVANRSSIQANTVTFDVPIPSNTTYQSFTAPAGATCNTVGSPTVTSLHCSAAAIPGNISGVVELVVKVNSSTPDGTTISATGTIAAASPADSNSANNSGTGSSQAIRESDLTITNTDSADPLNTSVSNVVTYTQTITNNGPSDAANIVVTETVPTGTTFGSVTSKPAGWNCTAPSGGVFTCSGPSLAATASGMIVFTVTNTTTGKLTQTATVSSDSLELNAADNTATAVTTIATGTQSDMQVTVTSGSSTVSAGSNVSFTVAVVNRGPATASNVTVTLPIPPNSTFQSLTFPGTWSCPLPAVGSTGTITCTTASLAVNTGSPANFVLTVQADGTATPNTYIGETATVSLGTPANDPDHTNDSATASSRVTNPTNADLGVTLSTSATSVKTGESFTLTSVVSNGGPAGATGVTLTIPITTSEQYVSVTTTQGSCIFAGGSVVCSLGSIANGANATVTVTGNAIALGDTTNTATVYGNENDPTTSNNTASVTMTFMSPTAVELVSFTAISDAGRVVLEWRTQEEVRNLGFNVYREVAGLRTKLNGSLIAGSAVRTRLGLVQHSASAYHWIDEHPVGGATYLLEDVSISDERTWNGPVVVSRTAAARLAGASSTTLAEINTATAYTPILFNPLPAADTEASALTLPGWITDTVNPSRPGRVQSPAKVQSTWLAGRAAVKIAVDHAGWYRVTADQLTAAGYNTSADPSAMHLYAEGLEVPIRVSSSDSGFEFYATGLDTPSTGTRVYWLTTATGTPRRIPVSMPNDELPAVSSYLATVEKHDRSFYFAALTTNGDQDNFFGDVVAGAPVDEHLTVRNLNANGASTASLLVRVQGITDLAAHDVQVILNGTAVGNISFTGMVERSLTVSVPVGSLVEGDNVVTLAPLAGDNDVTAVDRITITYPRSYTAVQDQLKFTVPARSTVQLQGFSSAARVFELDTSSMVTANFTQQPDGTFSADVTNPDGATRTYYAFTDGMVQTPSAVTKNEVSQLSSASNAADFVIVSHKDFIPALAPLVAARQQQGHTPKVVNIEDVYDEFNYGENSPQALRDFLATAAAKWHVAPKWLLLVGDASVDPRDFLDMGSYDFVPTKLIATAQLKTASDGWFSDFQNNGVPQIATGRLPVRTAADATAVVSKLLAYEQQAPGPWDTQALLVTDQNIGTNFSGETAQIQSLLPASIQPIVLDFASADPGTVRQQLLSQLNAGQLLVNYLGHGSVDVWSANAILNSDDPASLTNGGQLPFVIAMDCLNGFFHDVYQTSLAETMLLAPNGGAAAVWASSGLTEPESQFVMDKNLVQYLFANPSITIGEATTQAKTGVDDVDVKRTWNLFGDPTMKLRLGGN